MEKDDASYEIMNCGETVSDEDDGGKLEYLLVSYLKDDGMRDEMQPMRERTNATYAEATKQWRRNSEAVESSNTANNLKDHIMFEPNIYIIYVYTVYDIL